MMQLFLTFTSQKVCSLFVHDKNSKMERNKDSVCEQTKAQCVTPNDKKNNKQMAATLSKTQHKELRVSCIITALMQEIFKTLLWLKPILYLMRVLQHCNAKVTLKDITNSRRIIFRELAGFPTDRTIRSQVHSPQMCMWSAHHLNS